jgi:DMSO/TMAO reductase YedYZ heme-binding membrane subunit
MKSYLHIIKSIQNVTLALGIITLVCLPPLLVFASDTTTYFTATLYSIAHASVFFVMIIRPLADIFRGVRFIRPLVILRKGFGVLSASIVVSFASAKLMVDPAGYVLGFFEPAYWSLAEYAFIAHIADVTAILLLITSNNFSKRMLGAWWKRIQRLSYVYFYASAFYVFAMYGNVTVFWYMSIVTLLTVSAFFVNLMVRLGNPQHNPQSV